MMIQSRILPVLLLAYANGAIAADPAATPSVISAKLDLANELLKAMDGAKVQPQIEGETYRQTIRNLACFSFGLGMSAVRIYECTFLPGAAAAGAAESKSLSVYGSDALAFFKILQTPTFQKKKILQIDCSRPLLGRIYPDTTTCTVHISG